MAIDYTAAQAAVDAASSAIAANGGVISYTAGQFSAQRLNPVDAFEASLRMEGIVARRAAGSAFRLAKFQPTRP